MAESKPTMSKMGGKDVFYPGGMPFEIISPDELLLSEPVDYAEIPGSEGYFGVLPGHTPLITNLKPGIITLMRQNEVVWRIYVSGGVCEVTFERCIVLAERAFDLPQIDVAATEAEIAELKNTIAAEQDNYQIEKLRARLAEAEARREAAASQFAAKAK